MSDALLAAYDAVLFDLDGTVYQGTHVFPGSVDVLGELRDQGVAIRFVTNNASKAPDDVVVESPPPPQNPPTCGYPPAPSAPPPRPRR
jgi:phosphoglycolate phosphatase-like HAD superfamily hydrolase